MVKRYCLFHVPSGERYIAEFQGRGRKREISAIGGPYTTIKLASSGGELGSFELDEDTDWANSQHWKILSYDDAIEWWGLPYRVAGSRPPGEGPEEGKHNEE